MCRRVYRKQNTPSSADDMATLRAMMIVLASSSGIRTRDTQSMQRPGVPNGMTILANI
jgi:hypothetical protein